MAFTTERMEKVTIAGSRAQLRATIDALHRLNLLHVEDFTGGDAFFTLGAPFEEGSALSERLLKAKGLERSLEVPETPVTALPDLAAAEAALVSIEAEVSVLVEERGRLRERVKELALHAERARLLAPLGIPLELLSGYTRVKVWVGRLAADPRHALARLGPTLEAQVASGETGLVGAVFARAERTSAVEPVLAAHGFSPVEVPPGEGPADEVASKLAAGRERTAERLAAIEAELDAARARHGATLRSVIALLSIESEKATAPVRFRTGPNSFVVEGWVPARRVGEAREALTGATGGRLFFEATAYVPAGHHEGHGEGHEDEAHADHTEPAAEPPIRYSNPGPAKPFEMMMDLHSRPKYWELDPTTIIWFTFPLFFGLMIGDVGFGLLIMAVGAWFRRNHLFGIGGPAVGRMLFLAGVYTTVLGLFLYGEFMGLHFVAGGEELSWASVFGLHPALAHCAEEACHLTLADIVPALGHGLVGSFQIGYISKLHDVTLLLGLAVAIGLIQINAGLVIGFVNGLKGHGVKHAVLGKLSWILLQAGIAVVALASTGTLPVPPLLGWAIFGVAVAMLVAGEGAIAIMELPSILSNLLSYTRLTAVAMSKAGLAMVFNMAAFEMGLGAIGLVILFLGYVLLLGLGILAGGLHSLRLQFVEFFTKFYEGGGRTYQPFGHPLSAKAPRLSGTALPAAALAAIPPSESNPRSP